jgi:hypothetical protein
LSYGFFLEGFIQSRLVGHLHTVLVNIPIRIWLLRLILNHRGSLLSFSPGRGFVYDCGFCTVGLGGYYAKMMALGLVVISWLYFYISIIQVDWENHEGYALCVLSVIIRSLCSSVHSLSYLVNCHPVCEAIGDMACVSTVLSRNFLTCCGWSTPVSLC